MNLYIAYGSNLNLEQMNYRCCGARVIGTGRIKNYTLVYRGSKTGAYATIIPKIGKVVPVAVWEINAEHEKRLDIYEGFPTFYYKKNLWVTLNNGKRIRGTAYIMFDEAKVGKPSERYLEVCRQGYIDMGLDLRKFEESINRNAWERIYQKIGTEQKLKKSNTPDTETKMGPHK